MFVIRLLIHYNEDVNPLVNEQNKIIIDAIKKKISNYNFSRDSEYYIYLCAIF